MRLLRALMGVFVSLAMGVTFGALMSMQVLIVGVNSGAAQAFALGILAVLMAFAVLVAHEFGHLVAGLAVSLPFSQLTLGFLAVIRERGRLRLRLNTAWFQPAAYVLYSAGGKQRWGRAVMVAGGPLTNLLIAVACLVLANAIHPGPPPFVASPGLYGWREFAIFMPGNWVTALLNLVGLESLALCLWTLVPGRAAGLRTDGGQLLDCLRGRSGTFQETSEHQTQPAAG